MSDYVAPYDKELIAAVRSAASAIISPVILDAGCGKGELMARFSTLGTVYGVDLECDDTQRTFRADLSRLPFRDGLFDIIYSRSVFEHLENPTAVMDEFSRVLKPNGTLIIVTPNKYDYNSIIARWTPQWFHRWITARLGMEYDTFPVHYRCNTPHWYRRLTQWQIVQIRGLRHRPVNLRFSRILYQVGLAYDWLIDRLHLHALQPSLFVVLRKTT